MWRIAHRDPGRRRDPNGECFDAKVLLPPGNAVSEPIQGRSHLQSALVRDSGERHVPEHAGTADPRQHHLQQRESRDHHHTGAPLHFWGRQTSSVIDPGTEWGDRLNQTDLRLTKIISMGRTRLDLNVDFYNMFNSDAVARGDRIVGVQCGACRHGHPATVREVCGTLGLLRKSGKVESSKCKVARGL